MFYYLSHLLHSSSCSLFWLHSLYRIIFAPQTQHNKKVQQSWQTSALAMHLPLARLVSMPVIFCLHPSSSIVILAFYLGISEQMCENSECKTVNTVHWFDASCSVIPLNNSINLISPVYMQSPAGLHFCRWQYMRSSANFPTVFSESQNASPLDAKLEPDFNAKWPFNGSSFSASMKSH